MYVHVELWDMVASTEISIDYQKWLSEWKRQLLFVPTLFIILKQSQPHGVIF